MARRLKFEDMKKYIELESNSGCKLITTKFELTTEKIEVLCRCGNTYTTSFAKFKHSNKTTCNECSKKTRWNYSSVKKYIEENSKCKLLSDEYVNVDTKIKLMCGCGNEFEVTFDKFRGSRNKNKCNDCSLKEKGLGRRLDHSEFLEKFSACGDSNVEILSEYTLARNYIKCRCKMCGNIWESIANNLLRGNGCMRCRSSYGEKEVLSILNNNGVKCIQQKKYQGLRGVGGKPLSYDFYIPSKNLLVEYQGEFHDGTANQQTEEEFKIQQEHDKRKREYAKNNNIRLTEIWYWDRDNIEEILIKELNLH